MYDEETGFYYLRSRYYDPSVGRFLNADNVVAGVGGEEQGYNPFVYCFNNPVNMDDASGNWPKWIKNAVKKVADKIVKIKSSACDRIADFMIKTTDTFEKVTSSVNATFSTGQNYGISGAFTAISGQTSIAIDTSGNIAVMKSTSYGVTSALKPGASTTTFVSVTGSTIDKSVFEGYVDAQIGTSAGFSIYGVPASVSADLILGVSSNRTVDYGGFSLASGVGTPGFELYATRDIESHGVLINIYDCQREFWKGFKEKY